MSDALLVANGLVVSYARPRGLLARGPRFRLDAEMLRSERTRDAE